MATKTISVDLEAYARLKSAQEPNESFSQTIKRVVRPKLDVKAWLKKVRKNALSPQAVAAIEEQIASRRDPINQSRGRRRSR